MHVEVETFLAALAPDKRALTDRLRALIHAAAPALDEHIKWNAPSFDDRVTLNYAPKGGMRVILHRGAKPRDTAGFAFDDAAGLAAWPSPDRGVVTIRDMADLDAKAASLSALIAAWIAAAR
ncbi:hypothetical protein CVN68_13695 [Sphingomonas psychrotolerans]|uniref:YdhG-like domain-containing protein n=2 Tax=Sphingomonas psychrotolerans TaxID=1327635 RepID=A0A2K8ML83_9SPHN|nr:hypothetical protein CVN68_13695 [Sphingomonas psychrotolerans]